MGLRCRRAHPEPIGSAAYDTAGPEGDGATAGMEEIGIVCGQCSSFSPIGVAICDACGSALLLTRPQETRPKATAQPNPSSEEQLMEQARNYVCRECSTAVPSGHKFCGTCGAAVPAEIVELRTKYFGAMQTPGKARLILIRGEAGVDGLSYMLQGTEHLAGRDDGQILFPEDTWLSPRHATFLYQGGQLVVRDEGSQNGVYVRVRGSVPVGIGDHFMCGEQIFRVDPAPEAMDGGPDADQTYFYASPRKSYAFTLTQILAGGGEGLVYCATGTTHVGREECGVNFPLDVYMSGTHARIDVGANASLTLTDEGSKNGTYVRVRQSQPLSHGDYLFLGKQLLRVEITA